MWGDLRGWIVSGIIVAAMGLLLVLSILPQGITPPTKTLTLAMQPAVIPADPGRVMPAPAKECDAAENYRQAIEEYQSHEQRYDNWTKKIVEARDARPPAVQMLADAKDCAKMGLFSKSPNDLTVYDERGKLQAINEVGTMCNRIALVYAAESNTAAEANDQAKATASAQEARRYAEASFNLGRHLYEERLVFEEWSDGITLMIDATAALRRLEKDKAVTDAMDSFMVDNTEFRRGKVVRLWEVMSGIGEADKKKYAGDIFDVALHSPERMWRVEAILKLGRYKYSAATRGDQFGSKKAVAKLAADPGTDPVIHAAADAANGLTVEQFRTIK